MILLHKKRYQTCLELIEELRLSRQELALEKLSYNGILDPMAEGVVPVLVGEEENRNRGAYTGSEKEYEVDVLVGFSTDSGDLLGIITDTKLDYAGDVSVIEQVIRDFPNSFQQTVPMHSNRKVKGKRLWWWILNGVTIPPEERPSNSVTIYQRELLPSLSLDGSTIVSELRHMQEVFGERFRMSQVYSSWDSLFDQLSGMTLHVIRFRIRVSSGFYVRTFVSDISSQLGVPLVVYKLNRLGVYFT